MPEFIVKFPNPVRYLMDHPKQRDVMELVVHAPSEYAAIAHAIRVTNGDPGEMQVVAAYDPPRVDPPIEVEPDA